MGGFAGAEPGVDGFRGAVQSAAVPVSSAVHTAATDAILAEQDIQRDYHAVRWSAAARLAAVVVTASVVVQTVSARASWTDEAEMRNTQVFS